jgi:hypothetical protein
MPDDPDLFNEAWRTHLERQSGESGEDPSW